MKGSLACKFLYRLEAVIQLTQIRETEREGERERQTNRQTEKKKRQTEKRKVYCSTNIY